MIFENIFGKLKRKANIKSRTLEIVADYREKNSLVIAELVSSNIRVKFENLQVGDFLIGDVAIERKTVRDFLSSMINKRLIMQLKNLRKYKRRLLIIEGIDDEYIYTENAEVTGINANAVRGFLLSIIFEYNVPIVLSKDSQDTAKFIITIAKRNNKNKTPMSLRASRSSLSASEQLAYILEGFPGIGPVTSRKLLKKFGTLREIFDTKSNEEQIKKIIGKKFDKFKKLIESDYRLDKAK